MPFPQLHRLPAFAATLLALSGAAFSMGRTPPPEPLLSREKVQVLSRIISQSNSVGDVIVLNEFRTAFSSEEQPFLYFRDGQLTRFVRKGYHLLHPTVVDADTVFVVARKIETGPQADDKNYSIESCNIPQRQCTTIVSNDEFKAINAYSKYGTPKHVFHINGETYIIFEHKDHVLRPITYNFLKKISKNLETLKSITHQTSAGMYEIKNIGNYFIFNNSAFEVYLHKCKETNSCFLVNIIKGETFDLSITEDGWYVSDYLKKTSILRLDEASIRFGYFLAGGRVLFSTWFLDFARTGSSHAQLMGIVRF